MFDDIMTDYERRDMAEFLMRDEQAQNAQMTKMWQREGRTEQEIAILFFLYDHDQGEVLMVQAECLEYLQAGGKIH